MLHRAQGPDAPRARGKLRGLFLQVKIQPIIAAKTLEPLLSSPKPPTINASQVIALFAKFCVICSCLPLHRSYPCQGGALAQQCRALWASLFLSPRLRAIARADICGFGLGGAKDLSGNAQIGLGYAVGNSTDLNISWRYFGVDYNNGDNPDSGFSSYQNGLEIGLKFFF